MDLTIIEHPLAADRLVVLRDAETPPSEFRAAMHELSLFLLYEALRDLDTATVEVETPLGTAPGEVVAQPPVLVPILRAGLGMLEAGRTVLPNAPVGFVGARRNEETFEPEVYLQTVPPLDGGPAVLLDPMLATGGSLRHACELIRAREAGRLTVVCILAAPEGLETLAGAVDDLHVVTAAVDDYLTDAAFIYPGLGDAGDRQFGID